MSLDATFAALADPTRRAILARLATGDLRVSDVAEPFDVSLPAVSKHLSVLERAGLVVREKEGRVRRCQLVADPLREAADWIERYREFWDGQLDALARYLEVQQVPHVTKEELPPCPTESKPTRPSSRSREPRRPR